jgi:hypothetical protein
VSWAQITTLAAVAASQTFWPIRRQGTEYIRPSKSTCESSSTVACFHVTGSKRRVGNGFIAARSSALYTSAGMRPVEPCTRVLATCSTHRASPRSTLAKS